jgi:hypothetical protein
VIKTHACWHDDLLAWERGFYFFVASRSWTDRNSGDSVHFILPYIEYGGCASAMILVGCRCSLPELAKVSTCIARAVFRQWGFGGKVQSRA